MKLDKLIALNWGSLQPGEYHMGNLTLLSGPTGSGKSTLLDGLQTVMTAAYGHLYSYNPGQDETSQSTRNGKTKRTLPSYIVGAEDNLYARPDGAHGYLAAVFRPSENETGKPFTAIVGCSARVDGSGDSRHAVQEHLVLVLVDDAECCFEDFGKRNAEGDTDVVPVQRIEQSLRGTYKSVLNLRDGKKEYLCQLFGRFRGQRTVSFAEAELAAKAWSQAISHKPIGSVDELVKTQILEHDPTRVGPRIGDISELMRQVTRFRKDGERIQANIGRLGELLGAMDRTASLFEEAATYRLMAAKRTIEETASEVSRKQQAKTHLNAQLELTKVRLAEVSNQINEQTRQALVYMAHMQGIPALQQKEVIVGQIASAVADLKRACDALKADCEAAANLLRVARLVGSLEYPAGFDELERVAQKVITALDRVVHIDFNEAARRVTALYDAERKDPLEGGDVAMLFEEGAEELAALHAALTHHESGFFGALMRQVNRLNSDIQALNGAIREASARQARFAGGGANYTRSVNTALPLLREALPRASAQVLCDLVEPVDTSWQPAIEGYMRGARFNIVVNPDSEREAIDFVRSNNFRDVNIIQGALCLRSAKNRVLPSNSIVYELKTEHPIARAYLVEQYGSVVKVADSEELRHTPRGLTKDGKASGSRSMFIAEAGDEVFGKEVRRRNYEKAAEEVKRLEREREALQSRSEDMGKLLRQVATCSTCPAFGDRFTLDSAATSIGRAYERLASLDLTQVNEVEAEFKAVQAHIATLEESRKLHTREEAAAENRLKDLDAEIFALTEQRLAQELAYEDERQRFREVCDANPELAFADRELDIAQRLRDDLGTATAYSRRASEIGGEKVSDAYAAVLQRLQTYNLGARTEERFDGEAMGLVARDGDFFPRFKPLVGLRIAVREQLRQQRDIGLVKNLEDLKESERSFQNVFTQQFCLAIRNAVDNGDRTLKELNRELAKLVFGTDRFIIDWSEWEPEFREYYRFFGEIHRLGETHESADLFNNQALSPEDCKVRDRLVELLLDEDHDRALKALTRIADYRNYHRYEIWKESVTVACSRVRLSQWGTGSGGQLETPAYIVRAAVVTNRLKHFDKGSNLKLLVNDESFAKMDERRAHDVIRFIRDSLGMQLICAMPTKHAGAIKAEFTTEWSFTRTDADGNGEVDFVSEADYRELRPDALRQLWDARRAQVREQARLEFEAKEAEAAAKRAPAAVADTAAEEMPQP
jgi:energy-coupling factor transporter ATP-binding protein EcfA2